MRDSTRRAWLPALLVAGIVFPASTGASTWVTFVDETATRLVAAPGVGAEDVEEKTYAWGDVDHDGDIDLVVARREPWEAQGKRAGVLLLNEDGVLTDRTAEFASASLEPQDQGFLTPTNTPHVMLADVDLDGWLDVITATMRSAGAPKWLGYPRIYRNLQCQGACQGTQDWLGFRHEPDRIPEMLTDGGLSGFNPCFVHVDAGDVTGDGYPELWFIENYATGCTGAADFNSKLLVNQGASNPGFFVDGTEGAFIANDFEVSSDAASGWLRDMNGDGLRDVVKQDNGSIYIAYNAPVNPFYNVSEPLEYPEAAAYFVSPGDLNNDGRLDLVVSDDGTDKYLLNQGNATNGVADFIVLTYSFAHTGSGGAASDDGFAANSHVADLDLDGWQDVLITDVDQEVAGCQRRLHVYRNLGGEPGDDVVLEEQTIGSGCLKVQGNPPTCLVTGIPANKLEGVHDVAVFDIDGDGRKDLVVGRCTGTEIYINEPPPQQAAGSIAAEGQPESQLLLRKLGMDTLGLKWGASCQEGDIDYAIYAGQLESMGVHSPITCSTGGATLYSLPLEAVGNFYYLVVPQNGFDEGSYGTTSADEERPQGSPACAPRLVAPCP